MQVLECVRRSLFYNFVPCFVITKIDYRLGTFHSVIIFPEFQWFAKQQNNDYTTLFLDWAI